MRRIVSRTADPVLTSNIIPQSPEITSLEQLRRIVRPTEIPNGGEHMHLESPGLESGLTEDFSGLLADLLWSDPDKDVVGWAESSRGVGYESS